MGNIFMTNLIWIIVTTIVITCLFKKINILENKIMKYERILYHRIEEMDGGIQ